MSDITVQAELTDNDWIYSVLHPYDLSTFGDLSQGPFSDLHQAQQVALEIRELVSGDCD